MVAKIRKVVGNGLFSSPPDTPRVNMEQQWNDSDRGKPKDLGINVSQGHSVHHKSHVDCPGREPWPPWWEAGGD